MHCSDSQSTTSQPTDNESTPIAAYTSTEATKKRKVLAGWSKKNGMLQNGPYNGMLQMKKPNVVNDDVPKMPCAFMEVKMQGNTTSTDQKVLTLWPLYSVNAQLSGQDSKDGWIVIAKTEQWLEDLVRLAVDASHVGKAIQKLLNEMDSRWAEALKRARQRFMKEAKCATHSSDSEAEDRKTVEIESVRLPLRSQATLKAQIGGFNVTVLNLIRPKVLKVDADALIFITEYIVKRVVHLLSVAQAGTEAASSSAQPVPLAKFHFPDSPTPNVRDKVVWDPTKHAWRIIVKSEHSHKVSDQHKDEQGRTLSVDFSLKREDYFEARIEAYDRAIRAWNALDKSKKDRIQVVNRQQIGTSSTSSSL